MGFLFNFDNFKKSKKKINAFDLVDDFDYDFAESFEMEEFENDVFDDFDETDFFRNEETD